MVTVEDVNKMTVNQLKEELKKRNASTQGIKAELCARLVSLIQENETIDSNTVEKDQLIENEKPNQSDAITDYENDQPVSTNPKELGDSQEVEMAVAVVEADAGKEESNVNVQESVPEIKSSLQQEDPNQQEITEPSSMELAEPTDEAPRVENTTADATNVISENAPDDSKLNNPISPNDQDHPANDQSLSLGEKIKQNMKKRKERDSVEDDEPNLKTSQKKTNYIRIDNFQRPLNTKSLVKWLIDTTGTNLAEEMIWINTIKTHCYIDFPTEEEAENCINKVSGLKYPPTNTNLLTVHFTSVSVKEAPTSPEAAMKPGEWLTARNKRSNDNNKANQKNNQKNQDNPHDNTPTKNSKRKGEGEEGNKNPPQNPNTAGANLFKRATTSAISSSNPNIQVKVGQSKGRTVTLSTSSEQEQQHQTTGKEEANPETQPPAKPSPAKNNKQKASFDETHRKTETQPPIYWLPVDEETAERRRNLKSRLGSKKA